MTVENEDKKLEEKVLAGLEALSGPTSANEVDDDDDDDDDDDGEDESSTPDKSKPAEKKSDDSDKSDDDDDDDDDDDSAAEGSSKDDKESESSVAKSTSEEQTELPEALVRAAIHQKWTKEEVDDFFKSNPKLATKTFEKIYESTNKLTQEFANLGRVKSKVENNDDRRAVATNKGGIDIDELEKDYGDDPLFEAVKAVHAQNLKLAEKIEAVTKTPPKSDAVVEQQLSSFFSDETMKPYKEFYGTVPKSAKKWDTVLTGEQMSNRVKMIELADQVRAGAQVQGIDMGIDEALEKAHLLVSSEVREQVIRKGIQDSAIKRSKGLTLKPVTGKVTESKKPTTETELENVTAVRLSKVFK